MYDGWWMLSYESHIGVQFLLYSVSHIGACEYMTGSGCTMKITKDGSESCSLKRSSAYVARLHYAVNIGFCCSATISPHGGVSQHH